MHPATWSPSASVRGEWLTNRRTGGASAPRSPKLRDRARSTTRSMSGSPLASASSKAPSRAECIGWSPSNSPAGAVMGLAAVDRDHGLERGRPGRRGRSPRATTPAERSSRTSPATGLIDDVRRAAPSRRASIAWSSSWSGLAAGDERRRSSAARQALQRAGDLDGVRGPMPSRSRRARPSETLDRPAAGANTTEHVVVGARGGQLADQRAKLRPASFIRCSKPAKP